MAERLWTFSFGARALRKLEAGGGITLTPSANDKIITIDSSGVFAGDVTIGGDLTVLGTTSTLDTVNMTIEDNIIILNSGETGAGVTLGSAGLEIERGTLTNAFWLWDETNDAWNADVSLVYF